MPDGLRDPACLAACFRAASLLGQVILVRRKDGTEHPELVVSVTVAEEDHLAPGWTFFFDSIDEQNREWPPDRGFWKESDEGHLWRRRDGCRSR
jgi:hypothetical protein